MSSTNDSFSALPQYLQRRIDEAFDDSIPSNATNPADSGGGFVADSGGFLPEENSQIPLLEIPTALQRLDLQPDDEQVLVVFKNAAAGWKSSTNQAEEIGDVETLFVSRDDWRSVCAVLLEHYAEEYAESDGAAVADQLMADSGDDEEDEYQEPEDDAESASDDEDDEYTEAAQSTSRRRSARGKRRAKSSSPSDDASDSPPKKLTARQTKTCLETYALFFPSASPSELPTKRIGIKDLQQLTKLIGDKLKGEEIIEMLEEFSTSSDKTMSFADFGSMMVAAKLA
ncbi:hypothetical protein C8R43DRAFT_882751 [Mycena crocata]|nr:hypothetical protein C8R43DRAFT_882751 [Mycena crocata]